MRNLLLSFCFLFLYAATVAQQATGPVPVTTLLEEATGRIATSSQSMNRSAGDKDVQHLVLGPGCTATDLLSSASNMFTIGITEQNCIAVNNALNTLVFVHRNNASAFGGHSGQLRYDISTNGGASWTPNQGVLNPLSVNGTNGARYPNVAIYNPPGNTNPANAYLAYYGCTVAAAFNGTVSGVRKLDGTGNTESYNQPVSTLTLIPRSIVKGAPGVMWAVDYVYTGTAYQGFRILKGTWNGSTDFVWTANNTITPTFNTAYSGVAQVSDIAIAFDPSGQKGWFCALTHLTGGPVPYAFYPYFWKTTDGGNSWTGPEVVDLSQFSCIAPNVISPNVVTTGFDLDLVVDVYGNPHALVPVCTGNNAYAIFFANWHHMFDITQEGGLWNAVDVANVNAGRGTWGTAPNTLSMDMESQAARTDDGTKVFFAWSGSDAALALGTANQNPNLFGKAYDVVNREWTAMKDLSTCNAATSGKIFFPKMAENVLNNAVGWELPVIYGEFTVGTDPAGVTNFRYLDSLSFTNNDFTVAQCNATVSIAQGDTIVVCQGSNGPVSITGPYDAVRWSNGSTSLTVNASTPGWLYVAARSGCCVGRDSIFVVIDTLVNATFTQSSLLYTANFTDGSSGDPDTWAWDFGDGQTSTAQSPSHTYGAIGVYYVCLTVTDNCGTDTYCDSVTVTCPVPQVSFTPSGANLTWTYNNTSTVIGNAAYLWDFGDGGTSTAMSPSHSFATSGTYTVCLTVSDTCSSDSSCQTFTVTCPAPVASFTTSHNELSVDFTQNGSGGTSSSWDFDDGGTSTLTNPNHVFSGPGVYNVCLVLMDSCGADTFCTPVTVTCAIPSAAFTFNSLGAGQVAFTNGTSPVADSYLWDFGDGNTSTLTNPTHTYAGSGNYFVCLWAMDTCGTDSVCAPLDGIVGARADGVFGGLVNVYPNPANDQFFVRVEMHSNVQVQFRLVNGLGQELWQREMRGASISFEIPASGLAEGVYLLLAESEGRVMSIKLRRD